MELRLTIEEGQALAAAAHAPNPEQLSSLLARCDGWAAGLVLMLDGLRPGSARFGEPGQVTFDYFASELFGRLPVETQAILLDTCLAPWVNAEMASALTGNARAPHLLEELWRKHLFVYRRAEPISSYQYHPLFREFLQNQLHAVRGAEALVTAKRCAQLLAQVGEHDAAIDLFLRANEPEQAVQIVLSQARTLVGQGRRQTLDAWIGRLPASLVQRTPWLVYWQATGRVAVDSTEARGQLEFAFGRFRAESNVVGQVLAALGIIESVYLGFFSGAVSGS